MTLCILKKSKKSNMIVMNESDEEIEDSKNIKDLRMNNDQKQLNNQSIVMNVKDNNQKKTRHQYTLQQKEEVYQNTECFGVKNASLFFTIPQDTIKKWRSKKMKGEGLSDQRINNQQPLKNQELQQQLLKEILKLRQEGTPVSYSNVLVLCKKISKEQRLNDFIPSKNFISKFLKRSNLVIRKKTNTFKLELEELEKRFFTHLKLLQTERYYQQYDIILNMDESPFYFSNIANPGIKISPTTLLHYNCNQSYDVKGSKNVAINNALNEKQKIAACITVGIHTKNMTATKIKPFIIFKNKSQNPLTIKNLNNKFNQQCLLSYSTSGWQNSQIIIQYCDYLIQQIKLNNQINNRKTLLILDTKRVHESNETFLLLQKNEIDLLFIPGGTTSLLQPLDMSINNPLKVFMNKKYLDWQIKQINKLKLPQKNEFTRWLIEPFEEITDKIIIRSFECTGITLELDKLNLCQLSENLKQVCQELIKSFEEYLSQQQPSVNPYQDSYQVEMDDIFFNDIYIEKLSNYFEQ